MAGNRDIPPLPPPPTDALRHWGRRAGEGGGQEQGNITVLLSPAEYDRKAVESGQKGEDAEEGQEKIRQV